MLPTGLLFSGTTLNREEGRKNLIIIFLFLRYLVESEKKRVEDVLSMANNFVAKCRNAITFSVTGLS